LVYRVWLVRGAILLADVWGGNYCFITRPTWRYFATFPHKNCYGNKFEDAHICSLHASYPGLSYAGYTVYRGVQFNVSL